MVFWLLNGKPADEPGYVENNHLSRLTVASKFKRPTLEHDGPPYSSMCGLASDGVYMACPVTRTTVVSYTAFPPLPAFAGGLFLLHFP